MFKLFPQKTQAEFSSTIFKSNGQTDKYLLREIIISERVGSTLQTVAECVTKMLKNTKITPHHITFYVLFCSIYFHFM